MNAPRPNARRQAALLSFARWAAVLSVAFLLSCLGYYLYVNVINRAAAEVYVAGRGTAIAAVYGTVTVNSIGQLTLFSQNTGYWHSADLGNNITSQGTPVKKGQLLGEVQDEIGARQLKQAQADNDVVRARQKIGPPSAGPLKSAEDQLAALKKLPPGNVPQVQRDSALNLVNQLRSAVDNETLALKHEVDATSNIVKAAEEQQERTKIYAPFDGIVTGGFNEHAYILPNQPVFTVADTRTYITGQVNEEDVGQLRPGMKADVRLYAYGNATMPSTVTQILPSPEANSSRYTVNLDFDKPPDDLKFGLTGEMNIILGRKDNALTVPARALFNVDQMLIVEDGIVEQRVVKIGFRSLEFVEITEGITDGTAVVVSDQEEFRPGQRVRPVRINDAKTKKK